MNVFDVLQQIADCSSKNGKIEILRANDTPALRTILNLTYNKFLTYRINQLEFPTKYNIVQPDIIPELELSLTTLSEHQHTPTAGRRMIRNIMAKGTEENANWISRIVKRDLKIGISCNSINKAFPGLIPEFKVQLAHPIVDKKTGKSRWGKVNYPVVVEEKFDGMRVIIVCHGDRVEYFSREGHELDLHYLDPQVLGLRAGTKFVLDGEGIGIKYNPNCAVAKKNHDKGKPWAFAQGLSMIKSKSKYSDAEMREYIGFKVWDIIGYRHFLSQGSFGEGIPLKQRKMELAALFERLDFEPPNIQLVPNRLAFSRSEVLDLFRQIRERGGEGVIVKDIALPYEFKRSVAALKIKEFYTGDFRVIDAIEGTPDTKYVGMLGTLLVSDDGEVTGKLMGGFDEDQRVELWLRHMRGELVGIIVEADYMDITADNSLRHGAFLRERPDKTECSWH